MSKLGWTRGEGNAPDCPDGQRQLPLRHPCPHVARRRWLARLTPQYTGLEALHERYGDRGFAVVGFPCNQFGAQEPGSAEEIETFCSTTYGVTFPMYEKIDVNGEDRHDIYDELTKTADAEGYTGDIRWNFEKFLVSPTGDIIARFSPIVTPEAPELVDAIEAALPG